MTKTKGIPKNIKIKIIEYYQKKMKKPSLILNNLRKDFPGQVPSSRQIKDFLYQYRLKQYGNFNFFYLFLIYYSNIYLFDL